MLREACSYSEKAPDYEIRDGVVRCDFGDWQLYMPLRVFRIGVTRAAKCVKDHDAGGNVVPFRGG